MSDNNKIEFILEDLNCSNCAAKIEKAAGKINGVSSSVLNFVTKTLTLKIEESSELSHIEKELKSIVERIEPHVIIKKKKDKKNQNNSASLNKKEATILAGGAFIFLAALVMNLSFKTEFILYLLSYLLIGKEVLLKAVRNLIKGQVFDENFLMAVASIGAFAIQEYPESVAVMLFYQIGEMFQDMAVNRSRKSISELMDIRPDYANLKRNDTIRKVSPDQVFSGDILIIKPGEKVPLDGLVIEGESMVDTSVLTGESIPRHIRIGDELLSGSINMNGLLTIKVTKPFAESTVSKILDLVENAGSHKAPTENFITKFARYYTPFVVFSAAALAFIPPLLIPSETFSEWINRALVFLVVSCPCALVISIPLGFFGGIGGASRNGVLIKGSNYLEALNHVKTIVFDKTGTLTKGVFKVTKTAPEPLFSKDTLLEYAAYAEYFSNHPISLSIKKAYKNSIDPRDISDYQEISGHGAKAIVKGKTILAGNRKLMKKENITFHEATADGTIVYLAVDEQYAGFIVISDEVKEDSAESIKILRRMGIREIIMLTGDSRSTGEKISKQLGIYHFYTELLPHEKIEKLEIIEDSKYRGSKVMFVGDGINDAPALARADVGVAMGGLGSDAAIEAADVVLMTDEPSKLISALRIAKRTKTIVWQNIFFALSVKGLVLLLGAGGIATMWEAVFADVGVAIIAILNAMRVMKVKRAPKINQ